MYYFDILHNNTESGTGNRVVLQVASRTNGITFGGEEASDIFQELSDDHVDGLTLRGVGADPLSSNNIPLLTALCQACKEDYPNKTIWCYTKFSYEDVEGLDIMRYIDVLLDRALVEELADENIECVENLSQRVIDVRASRKTNKVVLYK